MLDARIPLALTVRAVPLIETRGSVTGITVWFELAKFLIVMLPLPLATFSLKVATRLPLSTTPLALLAGLRVVSVGGMRSGGLVVKFQVVSSAMPAKGLPEPYTIAPAAILTAYEAFAPTITPGWIVRTAPTIETRGSPTGITVWLELARFLMVMPPLPTAIFAVKVATKSLPGGTMLALSAGLRLLMIGGGVGTPKTSASRQTKAPKFKPPLTLFAVNLMYSTPVASTPLLSVSVTFVAPPPLLAVIGW